MNDMKKYACHRVYLSPSIWQGKSVITVAKSGEVVSCVHLEEETGHTEWIGGVVILTANEELSIGKEFSSFLQTVFASEKFHPLYAWHLYPFDFETGNFMPQSELKRLY